MSQKKHPGSPVWHSRSHLKHDISKNCLDTVRQRNTRGLCQNYVKNEFKGRIFENCSWKTQFGYQFHTLKHFRHLITLKNIYYTQFITEHQKVNRHVRNFPIRN
uniref:Uncharacterized protein n=1 Tax=Cacopsylla melanoneura TaxID=428564 RepID=A0A8D9F2J6_9HEMI